MYPLKRIFKLYSTPEEYDFTYVKYLLRISPNIYYFIPTKYENIVLLFNKTRKNNKPCFLGIKKQELKPEPES